MEQKFLTYLAPVHGNGHQVSSFNIQEASMIIFIHLIKPPTMLSTSQAKDDFHYALSLSLGLCLGLLLCCCSFLAQNQIRGTERGETEKTYCQSSSHSETSHSTQQQQKQHGKKLNSSIMHHYTERKCKRRECPRSFN
ncbi:Hypothetical predicted protein [Drosophila guanche]|uniref:Uncharacterized protein n=1 Tax=Drosophila guanche TaxID=7266 RepID=A0A3B0KQK4_DROGU|nr:Hypothetical predicted protein [Drosophila guanche]